MSRKRKSKKVDFTDYEDGRIANGLDKAANNGVVGKEAFA